MLSKLYCLRNKDKNVEDTLVLYNIEDHGLEEKMEFSNQLDEGIQTYLKYHDLSFKKIKLKDFNLRQSTELIEIIMIVEFPYT